MQWVETVFPQFAYINDGKFCIGDQHVVQKQKADWEPENSAIRHPNSAIENY
jgi:hypothetical protein